MLAPNRIVSLWDMQKILAIHLLSAIAQLERVQAILDERKRKGEWDSEADVPTKLRNHIAKHFGTLAKSSAAMGAKVTAKSADEAAKRLRVRKNPMTYSQLGEVSSQLNGVLGFEIGEVELYCLNDGGSAYYSPPEPLFGREVEARIPKASDDISEAGKCFATGRYTASVFHLMRAMEAAVKELSADLGIGNLDREWGKLLSDIGTKIAAMEKGADRNNWSQVHANLYHVKQAWRNETMHPKATYTEEEAREVFDAMRAFMRHLAGMLPPSIEEMLG